MEAWATTSEGNQTAMLRPRGLSEEGKRAAEYEIETQDTVIVRCWTCATTDGRLLELMDHEVELVRS
jgi:hypothetical protein